MPNNSGEYLQAEWRRVRDLTAEVERLRALLSRYGICWECGGQNTHTAECKHGRMQTAGVEVTTEDIQANVRYRIALKFAEKALSGDVQGCTTQEAQAAALEVVRRALGRPNGHEGIGGRGGLENAETGQEAASTLEFGGGYPDLICPVCGMSMMPLTVADMPHVVAWSCNGPEGEQPHKARGHETIVRVWDYDGRVAL